MFEPVCAYIIDSPLGVLRAEFCGDLLARLDFYAGNHPPTNDPADGSEEFKKNLEKQIKEYFSGSRTSFDILVQETGSDFQKKVWQEVRRIPYGTTASYSDLAKSICQAQSARAVARAVASNPIALITPCHRVIHKDGALGGFRWGSDRKRLLNELESRRKLGDPA